MDCLTTPTAHHPLVIHIILMILIRTQVGQLTEVLTTTLTTTAAMGSMHRAIELITTMITVITWIQIQTDRIDQTNYQAIQMTWTTIKI